MNRQLKVIVYIPTQNAPNALATARAAVALAESVGGEAAAILPAGIRCDDLEQCGVARMIRVEGAADGVSLSSNVHASVFCRAIEAANLQLGQPLVLLPFGTLEEEVGAMIAAALDGTALGKCSAIELSDQGCTIERPVYGGRAIARLHAERGPFVCVVRPDLVREWEHTGQAATVETVIVDGIASAPAIEKVRHDGPRLPPLESARIIISGGRGMGGAENFAVLEQIASEIGAVVACSLPAADAGWYPVSRQIGQSGKFVNPDLYIAVGISGMSQHMAGIGENVPIFAINNDPDSSIWELAEVGVLADWKQFLPALLSTLSS